MVDRIDKPERATSYEVKGPTESKKDKPHEEHRQEDLPTFKQKERSIYEEKFQPGLSPLKTIRLPLERVRKMIFHRAIPYHGNPMAEADLVWNDGRTTEGVTFLLRNWQDFLRIKNLKAGDAIDPAYFSSPTGHLEITIWQKTTASGSWELKEPPREKSAPVVKEWWQKNPMMIGLAVAGGLLLLTLLAVWMMS